MIAAAIVPTEPAELIQHPPDAQTLCHLFMEALDEPRILAPVLARRTSCSSRIEKLHVDNKTALSKRLARTELLEDLQHLF